MKILNYNYDKLDNFISYYNQMNLIRKHNKGTILEIGCGNSTLKNYLLNHKINIKTLDHNKKLKPDYVGDIRKLPFKKDSFDTIVIFEVLEHLPFEELNKVLKELCRVCKDKVIISIPYVSINISGEVKLIPKTKPLRFNIKLCEGFFKEHIFDGEHYWEMGKKGYSKEKVEKVLKKHFNMIEEYNDNLNTYHYFYILKKDSLIKEEK